MLQIERNTRSMGRHAQWNVYRYVKVERNIISIVAKVYKYRIYCVDGCVRLIYIVNFLIY